MLAVSQSRFHQLEHAMETLDQDFIATMSWPEFYHSELLAERQTIQAFILMSVSIKIGSIHNFFVPIIHSQDGRQDQTKL